MGVNFSAWIACAALMIGCREHAVDSPPPPAKLGLVQAPPGAMGPSEKSAVPPELSPRDGGADSAASEPEPEEPGEVPL
ncbi:MAG TPA: hypothetical protein VGJ84_12820 [Polyangiaceae bacterium]|jgi:hypothetical protein